MDRVMQISNSCFPLRNIMCTLSILIQAAQTDTAEAATTLLISGFLDVAWLFMYVYVVIW